MSEPIYIIVEMEKRELDAKILLAIMAAKKGHKVALTKRSRLYEKLHLIESGFIFLKSFGAKIDIYLNKFKKYGHKITGIDEEGLQVYDKDWIVGSLRFSKKIPEYLDLIFSWGENSKKIYDEYFQSIKKNIRVVASGNPRIDVIKKKFISHFSDDVKKITSTYKNYTLIATNFLGNNRAGGQEKVTSFDKKKFPPKEVENFDGLSNFQKKNFYEFEKLYEFLNKYFEDQLFLIRPHPGESIDYYLKLEKKFKNIKIIDSTNSIIPWILASDRMISSNCTTSIESYMLEKISINYVPFKDARFEYELPKLLSVNFDNIDDLKKVLEKDRLENLTQISDDNKKKAEKFIKCINDNNSYEIILNNLADLKIKKINCKDKFQNKLNFYYYLIKNRIKNIFIYLNKGDTFAYQTQINKRTNFNLKNIQERLLKISKAIDPSNTYSVTERYYGMFYIKKN